MYLLYNTPLAYQISQFHTPAKINENFLKKQIHIPKTKQKESKLNFCQCMDLILKGTFL